MKKSEIIAAIKELNKVMGLEPPIGTDGTIAEMREKLTEAAGFITENDTFSKTTMSVLEELGAFNPKPAVLEPTEDNVQDNDPTEDNVQDNDPTEDNVQDNDPDEQKAKESDPADEQKVKEEYVETKLRQKVQDAKKLDELRQLVNVYPELHGLRNKLVSPDFNGLAGPRNLKAAIFQMIGAPADAEKVATPKKEKTKKIRKSGKHIICHILDFIPTAPGSTFSKKDIVAKADAAYVAAGGATNLHKTDYMQVYVLRVLEYQGKIKIAGDTITVL